MVEGADRMTEFLMEAITNAYDNGYPTSGLTARELAKEIIEYTGETRYSVHQLEREIDRIRRVLCV